MSPNNNPTPTNRQTPSYLALPIGPPGSNQVVVLPPGLEIPSALVPPPLVRSPVSAAGGGGAIVVEAVHPEEEDGKRKK